MTHLLLLIYLFIFEFLHTRGDTQQNFIREAPCRGPIPYSFIYQLCQKRHPFRIPLNDKWYPFYILVQNAASLTYPVKYVVEYYALLCSCSIIFICLLVAIFHWLVSILRGQLKSLLLHCLLNMNKSLIHEVFLSFLLP